MANSVHKTFFKHRFFVRFSPDDFRRLLLDMVETNHWEHSERFRNTLGLWAWGTILVYRSRMVPFDFRKHLLAQLGENETFTIQNPLYPLNVTLYRQEIAMQLAIEVITRKPSISRRMEERPYFSQLVYDTLYLPSLEHERKQIGSGPKPTDTDDTENETMPSDGKILVNLKWIRRRLLERARDTLSEMVLSDFPPALELEVLFKALKDYLRLLSNPGEIRDDVKAYARELANEEDRKLWMALAGAIELVPIVHMEPGWEQAAGDLEEFQFSFVVDNYGYRPDAVPQTHKYVRELLEALGKWFALVDRIFPNGEDAMDKIVAARLLEALPDMRTIRSIATQLRTMLEPKHSVANVSSAGKDPEMDAPLRDPLEALQGYIRMLGTWSTVFQRGLGLVVLSSRWSSGSTSAQRMGIAFDAFRAVFEFDSTLDASDVLASLDSAIQGAQLAPWWTLAAPEAPIGAMLLDDTRMTPSGGLVDLNDFVKWIQHLEDSLRVTSGAIELNRDRSAMLEKYYVDLWHWPTSGAVSRIGDSPGDRILELLVAARHQAHPLVPRVGGNLTIAQWMRVLDFAQRSRLPAYHRPIQTGLGNLGLPELADALLGDQLRDRAGTGQGLAPTSMVAILKPAGPISTTLEWRPVDGTRSLMILPKEWLDWDRTAIEALREATEPPPEQARSSDSESIATRPELALDSTDRWALFVEFDASLGPKLSALSRLEDMARGRGRTIFFGNEDPSDVLGHPEIVPTPGDLGELLRLTAQVRPAVWPGGQADSADETSSSAAGPIVDKYQIAIARLAEVLKAIARFFRNLR